MNSASTIGVSLAELVCILAAFVAVCVFLVGFTIKVMGKFSQIDASFASEATKLTTSFGTERDKTNAAIRQLETSTTAAIEKENTERTAALEKLKTELSSQIKEFQGVTNGRLDKVEGELDKKFDTISASLEGIKTLVNTLAERIGAKYVERSEIQQNNDRLNDRITLVEKGYNTIVSQGDSTLTVLAGIRADISSLKNPRT